MMELLQVILLGIVEGLTEFLPVSSTGHLLLCEHWMKLDFDGTPFWKMFTVVIQIGAIAAVVVYFRDRIMDLLRRSGAAGKGADANIAGRVSHDVTPAGTGSPAPDDVPLAKESQPRILNYGRAARSGPTPLMAVIVGTIPVLVIGYAIHKWVEKHMEHALPVALALGIGGLIMLAIELLRPRPNTHKIEDMSWAQAIAVGFIQILAVLFPGTSRSAATIIGGMVGGMSREAAAEFSFFLAIPAMTAATGYSLLKHGRVLLHSVSGHEFLREMILLGVGTLVSFLVAWAVIAVFMNYIRRHTFIPFAIYRVILGLVVLLTMWHS